jgi:hypothetical protein
VNKKLKILLLILFSVNVYGESFTVLVKSGLNIRKEPNSKSERVGLLAFGTVVEAEINSETDYDHTFRYKHYTEIIEGKKGFWIKISHNKIDGYIFSGFGLVGEWVVKSTEINKEYRILRVGQYCGPINYDPNLNWYALTKVNGELSIKKTEVTLRLTHEYNELDTLGTENEYWSEFPLVVKSNIKDSILFLIGSKSTLEESNVVSQFVANKWGYSEEENFLYPEQTYQFYNQGKDYKFHAFEGVKLTKDNPEGYIRKYQIELIVGYMPEPKKYNISKHLGLDDTAERHCNYYTPQLFLVGDINKDGLPDFIYYSHTMTDSCGVCWQYHLFMSDSTNQIEPFRKVADEISCNCIT